MRLSWRSVPTRLALALLVLALAPAWATMPARAQDVSALESGALSIPEARDMAFRLVAAGRPDEAAALARVLVQRDPTDQAAWLALSQAERDAGRHEAAIAAGRRAWALSSTSAQRHSSALVTSYALMAAERPGQAQFWLRRSAQHAPDDATRARAVQQFRYVRSVAPWRTVFRFGLSPSSNINNAPTTDQLEYGGITYSDPTAQPLAGIELHLGLSTRRRFDLGGGDEAWLGLNLDDRRYGLSESERRKVPGADAADYASSDVELGFGLRKGPMTYEAGLGLAWYGGELQARFANLNARRFWSLSPRDRLTLGLWGELRERLDNDRLSSRQMALSGNWTRRMADGALLSLIGVISQTGSDSALMAHDAASASSRYVLGQPVLGAQASLNLGLLARRYDRAVPGFDIRRDDRATIGVSLFFSELDYFGFAPTIGMSAARTRSNISAYDTRQIGIEFSLQSVF